MGEPTSPPQSPPLWDQAPKPLHDWPDRPAPVPESCPRAVPVLKRQLALTGLKGEHVFGHDSGEPYHDLQISWKRWVFAHKKLKIRYREPYQMRHTSVTWNLMIGKNLLWVAQNHGHSAAVMLKAYAKWLTGSTDKYVAKIRTAMGLASNWPVADSKNA